MSEHDQGPSRVELARWFLDRDEVDEAARVLEPGDQLDLGPSDSLDLAAALERRGLAATREEPRRLTVRPAGEGGEQAPASLAGGPRRPPARAATAAATGAKKSA